MHHATPRASPPSVLELARRVVEGIGREALTRPADFAKRPKGGSDALMHALGDASCITPPTVPVREAPAPCITDTPSASPPACPCETSDHACPACMAEAQRWVAENEAREKAEGAAREAKKRAWLNDLTERAEKARSRVLILPPDRPRRAVPADSSSCPACHGTAFWISLAMVRICERCHPATDERIVARRERA